MTDAREIGSSKRDHEQAIARLTTEHDRLQQRIHAMYVDKLDGRIERHSAADQSYLEDGVKILELAVSFRQPFDLLADTRARALDVDESDDANLAKREVWLLGLEPFRLRKSFTMCALADHHRSSSHRSSHHRSHLGRR